MQKIILVILSLTVFTACSTREEPTNAYDEHLSDEHLIERERRNAVSELYQEKVAAYTKDFEEITFTGKPDDLYNVILQLNERDLALGIPREYRFIEGENQIEVYLNILSEANDNIWGSEVIEERLVVDDISFEDGIYIIQAEDRTFSLETFQESVKRLRDENGGVLNPSHYVPLELEQQWWEEAKAEVD